ncbi:MAG: hypothetical protein H6698_07345 [Myxococcales bacterium]|nr:hypothetical protein [Myxococcales bacterium]MCB9534121.1 hypothetical protein [Myxococcales bacterium]
MTTPDPPDPRRTEQLDAVAAAELLGWSPFKLYYYLSMGRVPGARQVDGVWQLDRVALLDARDRGLLP